MDEGPQDRDELAPYLELARLYRDAGFVSSARRCALKVVALEPHHEEALRLAREAREHTRSSRPRPRTGADEAGLPSLPSLEEFVALAKKHAP